MKRPTRGSNRIAVVALAATALALVTIVLLAWGGSIVDDSSTPPNSSPPSPSQTGSAPAAPPPASLERPANPAPTARPAGVAWPMAKLMRALDGSRIRVGPTVVRIEADTTLCSGEDMPVRRNGARFWTRFRCTFTRFVAGAPGRDLDFRVRPVGARRLSVSGARWIGG